MNSFLANGLGSVAHAPNPPSGFAETLTSRHVDTGEVRLHAAVGASENPPSPTESTSYEEKR
jgi:hypothetical protein